MYTIDRYVLRNFFRVFLICIVSITGMYLVADFVGNLTEFVDHASSRDNLWVVLATFYGARLPWFFDLTSRVIALIAAVFVVTLLQRQNEMAAVMAAGISRRRIVTPLIFATLAISLLAAANREFGIPSVRRQLCRRSRDWVGDGGRELNPTFDNKTGIWIGGERTYAVERRITSPTFRLPPGLDEFAARISARQALYRDEAGDRPGGYLFQQVSEPPDLAEKSSVQVSGEYAIYSPSDTSWLKENECFVASKVTFERLENGTAWYRLSSTVELIKGLRDHTIDATSDVHVLLHSRLIQPILDMTLVFLGLPIILSQHRRNVFVAVGLCVLLVAGFSIVVIGFQALGTNYLIRPSLAAWCPLMVFIPCAVAMSGPWRR